MIDELLSEGLMTVAEAAEFLSYSVSGVWKLMAAGDLAYTNIGRARRIPRTAVKALATKHLNIP